VQDLARNWEWTAKRARRVPAETARARRRGHALVILGLLSILVGVVYVLEVANGPGTGPKRFEERRGYDQVKESVHGAAPVGFGIALSGLAVTALGAWVLSRHRLAELESERAVREEESTVPEQIPHDAR
jgi:hypothetical protein